MKSKTAKGDR